MMKFTPEQGDLLDFIPDYDGIVLVAAGAGTGKSFMSEQIARMINPKKGLYTAFNKAIVTEGEERFHGLNIICKTFHALAYSYVRPTKDIEDISYTTITENISYNKKAQVIKAINDFYVSASTDMYAYMNNYFNNKKEGSLKTLAISYIEKMLADEIPPTFNYMLKYFHLMLSEGSVVCKYDLVILDEINDTTAVTLEIFKLIDAPKKLGLGETNQAIYGFLNLVNGFDLLPDAPVMKLTQSFRCSVEIASRIQSFMRKDVDEDFTFVGTDEPVVNGKTLYCTLTNAKIINRISERLAYTQGFHLLRQLSEIFAYPMAITTAAKGKEPYQKKYRYLLQEYKAWKLNDRPGESYFQHLLDSVDDQETKSAINMLMSFSKKGQNIFALYKKAQDAPDDPMYTIATVYTSKGLEFENVYIADDLNGRIQNIRNNGGIKTHEDLEAYRCYYVAASRCGSNLVDADVLPGI